MAGRGEIGYVVAMRFRPLAASVTFLLVASGSVLADTSGNPVIGGAADPHGAVFGDRFYAYPTTGGGKFRAFSTNNLGDWQDEGVILDFDDVSWIDGSTNSWAPAIHERDGNYYFYYSVGGPTSRIGVATGTSPAGPFVDSGQPLLTDTTLGGTNFEAIDPMVFDDPESGKTYLYAGGSRGATLRVFELGDDLTSLAAEVPVQTPRHFTEGAFMHYRDGTYYLSYSSGRWFAGDYSVHYATSDSATGPWNYEGEILASNGEDKGPGHHSIFENPATGESYILYHRWENRDGDGPFGGARDTAIDILTYDANGRINPIVMTNTGVPLTAIPEPTTAAFALVAGAGLLLRRR